MSGLDEPAGLTRRRVVALGAGAVATSVLGGRVRTARGAANGITTFASPRLRRYVQALPPLDRATAGGTLTAAAGTHRFHPDLPDDVTWGYGGSAYLGPVLTAHRDDPVRLRVVNGLGPHRFARDIDTTVHGASALDRTAPRQVLHLHGGLTEPRSDGHPLATRRPGGTWVHRYGGRQPATALWYHDHAMGITRLNVYAGLAGMYLMRDDHDTGGRRNPLGLPSGRHEVPLVLQDKTFADDGRLFMRTSTYVAEGQWEGGQAGDVAVVNGAAWPELGVDRALYRLRVLNASNLRTYALSFSNGMRFWVIGSDQGLLNAPQPVTAARIAASERLDLLVDFGGLAPDETVVLRNGDRLPFQFQIFGDPEIGELMRFRALRTRGPRGAVVPAVLRGGRRRPARLRPWPTPVLTRNMTISQPGDARFPPALMNLNNLTFDTADVDRPRAGTVEQWNLINLTTDEHPIHVHIATLRVLERRPFNVGGYVTRYPRPPLGVRWTPPAENFLTGRPAGPAPWEQGDKDTVYAPAAQVTRILVRWPSEEEMGFDPDAPFAIPATVEQGAPATDRAGGQSYVCRLSDVTQPAPDQARGYVWHCHVIDHEDHEMMLPIRIAP